MLEVIHTPTLTSILGFSFFYGENVRNNLTQDRIKYLLNYDECSGFFTWKNTTSIRVKVGDIAGTAPKGGYLKISIDGYIYSAHRLVWLWFHGCHPSGEIDHIDRDKMNNKISNLRIVSRSVNMQNHVYANKNNISGLRGVHMDKRRNRWVAAITINGRNKTIGSYQNKEDAHHAYLKAKMVIHKGSVV